MFNTHSLSKSLPVALLLVLVSLTFMRSQNTVSSYSADYKIVSAMDKKIRAGVKAYRNGDLETAAMFMRTSLKDNRSKAEQAKLQSNLCAIYAAMNNTQRAALACDKALELAPHYTPARSNAQALKITFAKQS